VRNAPAFRRFRHLSLRDAEEFGQVIGCAADIGGQRQQLAALVGGLLNGQRVQLGGDRLGLGHAAPLTTCSSRLPNAARLTRRRRQRMAASAVRKAAVMSRPISKGKHARGGE
jgi:hypothetical protein